MDNEPDLEQRRVLALERLADALHTIGELETKRFALQYPEKKEGRDAIVTHRQTEEERLRESQGASLESDQEWIGRREAEVRAAQGKTTG